MSPPNGVFITGTDTHIGKTVVSAFLLSTLKQQGKRIGYFKPIQTGEESDTATVVHLAGLTQEEYLLPSYCFSEPMAPSRAAAQNQVEIETNRIVEDWLHSQQNERRSNRFWIIEGAGGILVPINRSQNIRDLIKAMELQALIVSSTRLGTINHTLLTVEAARFLGCSIAGIILNGDPDDGLTETLTHLTDLPILANIPRFLEINPTLIQRMSVSLFKPESIRSLFHSE